MCDHSINQKRFCVLIVHQKREILKACSPFAVKYFLKLHSGKWNSLTTRVDQYRSLIYSLIGKRGNLPRSDFETIEKLLQSLMSAPQKRKLKPIEKSFHKWNRQKHLDNSLPIFPYCKFDSLSSNFQMFCLFFLQDKVYQVLQHTIQQEIDQLHSNACLKIFDADYKPDLKDRVDLDPKRQALWLPLIYQLMMQMNVPSFRKQMDLQCNDMESSFVKSRFFSKFQCIKYTKVCVSTKLYISLKCFIQMFQIRNGSWFFQFDWFQNKLDPSIVVQVLDVTKRYPSPSTVESKEDIDEWNDNEFQQNKFSKREILVAEWRKKSSNQFEFQISHQRL